VILDVLWKAEPRAQAVAAHAGPGKHLH
jgi:hypothetical protein